MSLSQTDVMKTRISSLSLSAVAVLGLLTASALDLRAQDPVTSNATTPSPAAQSAPVQLSYGVAEVVKLAKANVSEDTILAFIGNSGRVYNLTVNEIVYLRQQGMSDHLLTAMLEQRRKVTESAAPQPNYASASAPQYAPVAAQPATTVQAAPAGAPVSTVYVMPSSSTSYFYPGAYPAYTDGYPYYGGYAGYAYPGLSLSLGFGIGSGWCGTGWYGGGGYRGYGGWGGYYGGGYRGGGGGYYGGGGYRGGGGGYYGGGGRGGHR